MPARKKTSTKDSTANLGFEAPWRVAAMNMAIRGIDFNFGKEPADTFNR